MASHTTLLLTKELILHQNSTTMDSHPENPLSLPQCPCIQSSWCEIIVEWPTDDSVIWPDRRTYCPLRCTICFELITNTRWRKSRCTVVSTPEFILVLLLFIYYCIISHRDNYKPMFASLCIWCCLCHDHKRWIMEPSGGIGNGSSINPKNPLTVFLPFPVILVSDIFWGLQSQERNRST